MSVLSAAAAATATLTLSWTCQLLSALAAGLGALLALWTLKLLVRHAWLTHRLSCFSKPHANSWLFGHLGQVGDASFTLRVVPC